MTAKDTMWSPFDPRNAIGDAGRQPEIRAVSSDLNVGVTDTALDFLTIGPLELRACSSRGWSHRYKGTPRQDSYAVLADDEVLVVAVADGVSEGTHSQVAADTAARAAVKVAADHITKSGAVDWLQVARRVALRIVEEAEYRQIVPNSRRLGDDINKRISAVRAKMSTTLIAAVIKRTPTSEGFEAEIGVIAGDSAAYQLTHRHPDMLTPVGGGKTLGGPISSTTVKPLPGAVSPETVTVYLQPGEMLVLGTDGMGDPIGDGTNDFGRELALRWRQPPTITDFMLAVNAYRRTFDDDRTAVGIWVRPDAALPDVPSDEADISTLSDAAPDVQGIPAALTGDASGHLAGRTSGEGPGMAPLPGQVPAETNSIADSAESSTPRPGDDLAAVLDAVMERAASQDLTGDLSGIPRGEAIYSEIPEPDPQSDFPQGS